MVGWGMSNKAEKTSDLKSLDVETPSGEACTIKAHDEIDRAAQGLLLDVFKSCIPQLKLQRVRSMCASPPDLVNADVLILAEDHLPFPVLADSTNAALDTQAAQSLISGG